MCPIDSLTEKAPPPAPAAGPQGCGTCWAAGYCASYDPASVQVPPTCPLNTPPAKKAR